MGKIKRIFEFYRIGLNRIFTRSRLYRWAIWIVLLVLTPAVGAGDTVVLDFAEGLSYDVVVDSGPFTVDTSQGNLRLTKSPSDAGFHRAKVWARYVLCGDFEAAVDFELFEFPHPPTFNNQMQLDGSSEDVTFLIARQKGLLDESGVHMGPIDGYTAFNTETGVTAAEADSSDTAGKMRIIRSGDMWSFWYVPEGEGIFTVLEELHGPTDKAWISMDLQNNGTGDPLDAAFDNLILCAETIRLPGCGDINGDGVLTPEDALRAFQWHLLNPCELAALEVTQDGDITPGDALCIFQKYLAIPSCLDDRPECPWD